MSPRAKPTKGSRPKVSNAKAAKANRPKAARAAARPSPGPGRGRGGAQSTRGANRKPATTETVASAAAESGTAGRRYGATRDTGRSGGDPLRIKAVTRGLGGDQVEGRQAVRELLLAGRRKVHEIWIATDQDEAVVLDDIAELALSLGVPVRDVARSKLYARAKTEAPQGILALAHPLPEVDVEDLVTKARKGPRPFLLLVDGVTDPGNLGALLRTAEGAGVTGVILPKHRAVHVTPTVTKTAAGAVEYLPMAVVGGLPATISKLRDAGVWVIGLDEGGSETLFDLALADEPVALVLGAEGKGLSRLVRQRCDVVASIPLGGRLSSLNVAAAGALACFEVARRRHAIHG
jgi:23S rRNA (guanosine2251-2'-O)-methyltransferase